MIIITIIKVGDKMINTIIRTIFFYFFIMLAYRIMGKREIGQLGIIDLIVSILIAELVAISIENYKDSIWLTIIPIGILVILEVVFAFISVKSRKFNRVFGGKPTIIINKGKLMYNNLLSQRYSLDDLLIQLRQKSISSIEDVEYAVLEPNGKLSIFEYGLLKTKKTIPLPIIIEGVIQRETLNSMNRTEEWIRRILDDNNLEMENIFYAVCKNSHIYLIKKSNFN